MLNQLLLIVAIACMLITLLCVRRGRDKMQANLNLSRPAASHGLLQY
jgi:uncharacterized membrane protein affecting hemolysin expression